MAKKETHTYSEDYYDFLLEQIVENPNIMENAPSDFFQDPSRVSKAIKLNYKVVSFIPEYVLNNNPNFIIEAVEQTYEALEILPNGVKENHNSMLEILTRYPDTYPYIDPELAINVSFMAKALKANPSLAGYVLAFIEFISNNVLKQRGKKLSDELYWESRKGGVISQAYRNSFYFEYYGGRDAYYETTMESHISAIKSAGSKIIEMAIDPSQIAILEHQGSKRSKRKIKRKEAIIVK